MYIYTHLNWFQGNLGLLIVAEIEIMNREKIDICLQTKQLPWLHSEGDTNQYLIFKHLGRSMIGNLVQKLQPFFFPVLI